MLPHLVNHDPQAMKLENPMILGTHLPGTGIDHKQPGIFPRISAVTCDFYEPLPSKNLNYEEFLGAFTWIPSVHRDKALYLGTVFFNEPETHLRGIFQ